MNSLFAIFALALNFLIYLIVILLKHRHLTKLDTEMSYKKEFLEGMGSVYDIKGDFHFNDFNRYPGINEAIHNTWINVGTHINNAVCQYVEEKEGKKNSFGRRRRRKCTY